MGNWNSWLDVPVSGSVYDGLPPGYENVKIKPCIPQEWGECSMKRVFRGDEYLLRIINKNKAQSKVRKISVDGYEIQGNEFKCFFDGKQHEILVEME